MVLAVTNQGRLNFMVFKERFWTAVFLEFLRRSVRQYPRKVNHIVDRHPVHHSQKVNNWLEGNSQKTCFPPRLHPRT